MIGIRSRLRSRSTSDLHIVVDRSQHWSSVLRPTPAKMLNFYPGRINTHFKISPTPVLRDRAGNADCCAERYYYNSDTDSEWGHWGDHSVILKEAFRPLHELPKCRLIYRCSSDWERLISISILKASVVGTQWYCTRGDWAVARSVPSFCDCVGLT